MSLLLDTNVVSEGMKPQPNTGVIAWMATVDEDRVYISVVTLTELRYGIERMAAGSRRKRRYYPQSISAKVDAWPVVYKSEDLLIKQIP